MNRSLAAEVSAVRPGKQHRAFWKEHLLPLLLYLVLTILLTWPGILAFTTKLISSGGSDPRHNLWFLWHVREALLGRQGLFSIDLIFYPYGASMLTHGLGPVTGLFALPFWPWGMQAAHNGAVMVGFGLTGYFMYLFARGLKLNWSVALFAGVMFMVSPMHMVGLYGHITKVFLGLLPLAFLALHYTLSEERSSWWAAVTALVLLLNALHNGHQFIFVSLGLALLGLWHFWQAAPARRHFLLKRALWLALSVLVIVTPLLLAILRARDNPHIVTGAKLEAYRFRPDALELILPPRYNRLFGAPAYQLLQSFGISPNFETAVFISWVGLFLTLIALLRRRQQVLPWLGLLLISAVLALGPSLQVFGRDIFTDFQLPVTLPFAFVSELPGLAFIRTPGRFMILGGLSLTVAAAYGLNWLRRRYPRWGAFIVLGFTLLLLVENWPRSWPLEELRPIPDFYKQLAQDPDTYGVLDLPFMATEDGNYITYSAHYQMYQVVHGKGIATAYLSRVYSEHPLFPCLIPYFGDAARILYVNDEPAKCYANILKDLHDANYRYIVWHKPQEGYRNYVPGSWGARASLELLSQLFGDQPPFYEDELVRVYTVPDVRPQQLTLTLNLGQHWYPYDRSARARWAYSPATIEIASPTAREAVLEILPNAIYVPGQPGPLGDRGQLTLQMENGFTTTVALQQGEVASVPITLRPGVETITFSLASGNFYPNNYGQKGNIPLSFALRSIRLVTPP